MPWIDRLFAIGSIRKAIWRYWYPFLTRRLKGDEVIFLNYAYETEPPMAIPLSAEDEKNRACIQLYHHVGTQRELANLDVLEISCGHGGGASYLTRTLKPASYVGLDLNPSGIEFCRKRHLVDGLRFIQGDAEDLPFPDASFDAVINVEASHCYPNLPAFLGEVARVLKSGGHFLYADFRFSDGISAWETALAGAPLRQLDCTIIDAEVLRGMDVNSARSSELLAKRLPGVLQSLGGDFAGVRGSRIYQALQSGELSYRSYCFVK